MMAPQCNDNALDTHDLEEMQDINDLADILLRLSFASQNYQSLLKVIYGYDVFDRSELQTIINDLAMDLMVKVPQDELSITRKKSVHLPCANNEQLY